MRYIKSGFDIETTWEFDESPDLSHLGLFSDIPEEGAIPHTSYISRTPSSRTLNYFNPCNPEYAEQDYRLMMEIESGHTPVINLKVTASRNGIQLGEDTIYSVVTSYRDIDLLDKDMGALAPLQREAEQVAINEAIEVLPLIRPTWLERKIDQITKWLVTVTLWATPAATLAYTIVSHFTR